MMWWGHGYGMDWGWMLFGGFMMVAFWGGLILLGVWLVRSMSQSGSSASPRAGSSRTSGDEALAILRARYARGEITSEEFHAMRADLLHDGAPPSGAETAHNTST